MFEQDVIALPTDVFRLIRDLLSDYCGLYFDDDAKYKVESRLQRRLQIHNIDDYREYYRFLKYDKKREEELQQIIDILTVNETYFFREIEQLNAFREEILPEMKEKNKDRKTLNVWSAGCSSGEEPYSLAMLVLEHGGFRDWTVNIYGSDINQRVLQVARDAVYKKNSFRTTNMYFIKTYFDQLANGEHRVSDKVKKFVSLSSVNLIDSFQIRLRLAEKMDVIFCRNVLIYFNHATRRKVIENYFNSLKEGGYLFLGHTESLINISSAFTLKHLKNDMVYQKPLRAAEENTAGLCLTREGKKINTL